MLVDELRKLRLAAGQPSLRALSAAAGGISHVNIGDILKGRTLPRLETLLALVDAMHGDRRMFTQLWEAAHALRDPERVAPTQIALLESILKELQLIRKLLEEPR